MRLTQAGQLLLHQRAGEPLRLLSRRRRDVDDQEFAHGFAPDSRQSGPRRVRLRAQPLYGLFRVCIVRACQSSRLPYARQRGFVEPWNQRIPEYSSEKGVETRMETHRFCQGRRNGAGGGAGSRDPGRPHAGVHERRSFRAHPEDRQGPLLQPFPGTSCGSRARSPATSRRSRTSLVDCDNDTPSSSRSSSTAAAPATWATAPASSAATLAPTGRSAPRRSSTPRRSTTSESTQAGAPPREALRIPPSSCSASRDGRSPA